MFTNNGSVSKTKRNLTYRMGQMANNCDVRRVSSLAGSLVLVTSDNVSCKLVIHGQVYLRDIFT